MAPKATRSVRSDHLAGHQLPKREGRRRGASRSEKPCHFHATVCVWNEELQQRKGLRKIRNPKLGYLEQDGIFSKEKKNKK